MRFLPTKIHGLLDYLVGAFLIAMPWLFGFAEGGAETWVPVLQGAGSILYSLLTDYEWGVFRKWSMRTHLSLDLLAGILLASSPWVFGFADRVFLPHLLLGIFEIGASLITRTHPGPSRRPQPITSLR